MISIDIFSGLSPLVQSLLIIGLFAVVLSIAFSHTAATNLIAFLRALCATYLQYRRHEQDLSPESEPAREDEKSGSNAGEEQKQPPPLTSTGVNEQ
jgi:uncharacterized membrane protein